MDRSRILFAMFILALAGSHVRGDSNTNEPAVRAWAISDTVLSKNIDPPTRQQMFLAGLKAVAKAGHDTLPSGLALRVSDLSNADQLASLMAETWANSKLKDRDAREEAFFNGLLSIVPNNGRLLSSKERKVEESFQANLYVGIQVALSLDEKSKYPVFQQILEGGPAEYAGANAGDLIEEVNGVSVHEMPLVQVIDRLRGEEGTDVKVRFRRPPTGEVFTKEMTRGRLPRPTIQGLSQLPDKRWNLKIDGPLPIGFLKITEISGSTPRELRAFAEQLESDGVKALVLDLREVSVARFHPTVLLADALLDDGIIGRVETTSGEKFYRAEPDALFRGWPMVVLANSTPPSEVVWLCEALRDNRKATILGKPVVVSDPYLSEIVAIPGGEWSVQMATGLLRRGDGQALAQASTKDRVAKAIERNGAEPKTDPSEEMAPDPEPFKKLLPRSNVATPNVIPQDRAGVIRRHAAQQDLDKARTILAEALKSAGK